MHENTGSKSALRNSDNNIAFKDQKQLFDARDSI